jgi:transcriptional regulator with XRE-family HTH domain
MNKTETFGQTLRRLRESAGISLRAFAKMVERTPTYISKIERDDLLPPAEEVIKEMARILRQDFDDMLSLAGRIPPDLPEIILKQPKEMALMLRTAKRLTPEQLNEITDSIADMMQKNKEKL